MPRLSGEERKGSILDAAISVFARGGFNGSTTSALARAAGITEALLYRHFRSKKQLFLGAVTHVLDSVDAEVGRLLERHEHPVRALRALFAYFVSQLTKNPEFGHLIYVVAIEIRDDPELKATYVRYQESILGRLEEAIRRWEREGYLREGVDPRAAAWLILGAHQTLTLMEQTGNLDELGPQHVRSFVTAFLTDEAKEALRGGSMTFTKAINRVVNRLGGHTFQITPEIRLRRVHRLYENAKRDQWNASERLPRGDKLPSEGLTNLEREAICRVFSQLYYGERGAQVISGQLCTMVDDNEASKFLSSQCMDEARHVEVFESLLLRIDTIYPMNPFLNALLTDMKRTDRLEEKLVGMNLLVEGLALTVFKFTVKLFEQDPRFQNEVGRHVYEAIKLILRDESRHVGFGVLYLPKLLRALPKRRLAELQARQLAWMSLLFGSVRYHKRDSAIVGIPYVDLLADILEEHQARVAEMGVEGLVTGEQLGKLIPALDGVLDRVTGYEAPVLEVAAVEAA